MASGWTRTDGKREASCRECSPVCRGATAIEKSGRGQQKRSRAHRCRAAALHVQLPDRIQKGVVLDQRFPFRAARDHQYVARLLYVLGGEVGAEAGPGGGDHLRSVLGCDLYPIAPAELVRRREHLDGSGHIEQPHPGKTSTVTMSGSVAGRLRFIGSLRAVRGVDTGSTGCWRWRARRDAAAASPRDRGESPSNGPVGGVVDRDSSWCAHSNVSCGTQRGVF